MVAVVEGINQIVTSDLLFVRTRFYFHQQLVIYYMESMVRRPPKISKVVADVGFSYGFKTSNICPLNIMQVGFTVIRVGVAYYGLRPVVEFVTFNFSMQGI